ncbi:MAG: hypothetical protein IKY66_08745 [Bacteroidales bacterium]|nr:hypothetical protein [Bacteroidales bacterium]
MSRTLHIIISIIILAINTHVSDGKDSLSYDCISHRITAEIHGSYNLPNHHYYNGGNPSGKVIGPAGSYHLKYSFALPSDSGKGKMYPAVYQGLGLSYHTLYSHDLTGSPVTLYLFQGARVAEISPEWSFGYEWNLGWSYGWKPNGVVSSRSNICITVALPFYWKPSPSWEVQIGPEYTHFSNGDTSFPNGGANLFGIKAGITRIYGNDMDRCPGRSFFAPEEELKESMFKDRIHYDIMAYGAWRSARIVSNSSFHLINRPFVLGGINFNPLYRLNRYFCAGPALDLQTDTSTGLHDPIVSENNGELISYSSPSFWDQTSCGLSVRGELQMPYFSINLGVGHNVIGNISDTKRFYTTYNLKTFVSKKMFLCLGYRLSFLQYTHNLMFGIGFRL